MRIFSFVFIFIIFISAGVTAVSAQAEAPKWNPSAAQVKIQQNPFLKQLIDNGVALHSIGNEQGFDGWVLTKDGQVQILYSRPDSDALLTGMLIGAGGENLTALQLARYEAISGNSMSDEVAAGDQAAILLREKKPSDILFVDASNLDWLGYGANENKDAFIYVFVNMASEESRAYFERLLTIYAKDNLVQVRAVPYSTNTEQRADIIKIYSHPTPAKALLEVMSGNNAGIAEIVSVDTMTVRADKTKTYLDRIGLPEDGSPLTLYRGADSTVKIVRGMPTDLQAIILDATVK